MLQGVWKSFLPLIPHKASGPSRDVPGSFAKRRRFNPVLHDLPFWLLARIVASLVLKWSSCSLLWSSYHWWVSWGREIALPLIFVDLVPRVGGLGAKFFSGMHWIKLGLEALKHARKPFPLLMRTDVWGQQTAIQFRSL